jgi:hypothetical protein
LSILNMLWTWTSKKAKKSFRRKHEGSR